MLIYEIYPQKSIVFVPGKAQRKGAVTKVVAKFAFSVFNPLTKLLAYCSLFITFLPKETSLERPLYKISRYILLNSIKVRLRVNRPSETATREHFLGQ